MKLQKYNLEQLINAVSTSTSIRESLGKLGVAPMGGNYDVFRKAVKFFEVDTSHFTGQAGSGIKNTGKYRPSQELSEVLKINNFVATHKLRLRLIREGYFEPVCSCCDNTEWMGRPIPLELDHINGRNDDNRIENLRLLCPNCHAQTPTHRGKNMRHLNPR